MANARRVIAAVSGAVIVGIVAILVVTVMTARGGSSADDATSVPIAEVDRSSPVFPRTATYVLDQDKLPPISELARYDVVIVDAEWQHRLPNSFFTRLRRADPGVKLLAYVNLVDSMPRTGSPEYWANAYSLWQFDDSTTSNFPREWLAHTASGKPVHEWPGHVMVNLTDEAPKVDGQIYAEYAAHWVVRNIWATGLWDGIFLDVWADRIYTADKDGWDINGDGVNEPDAQIYGPGKPLDRGLTIAENIMRSAMPTALLVANGDRAISGQRLNGRAFESFADRVYNPDRAEIVDWTRYVDIQTSGGFRDPVLGLTINKMAPNASTDETYRRARFFLTATLTQNAWWAPMGLDYGQVAYYDEMNGGGIGRGYLGHAIEADPNLNGLTRHSSNGTGSPAHDVFRRDFEHGISLVNMGDQPRTIKLERTYRHLRGAQDPTVNNGAEVRSVTIPANDGVILLRVD